MIDTVQLNGFCSLGTPVSSDCQITSLLTLTLLAAGIASASVIFSTGNNPQTDEPVLFHDSCAACVDGPGTTVIGHMQFSNILVNLSSTDQLVAVDPGHNTVSTPLDAGFNNLSIVVPGYTFTSIILQLTELSLVTDGTVTFTRTRWRMAILRPRRSS